MKIFIATDVNIVKKGDKIYVSSKVSIILRRYFTSFGYMVLCARFIKNNEETKMLDDITDIVTDVVEIKSLSGLLLNKNNNEIQTKMEECDLVIGRCPSIASYKAFDVAKRLRKPFLAESMGDAWDAYWNHGIQGKIIAPYMFLKMKSVVNKSDYAVYVTNEFLQKRYPCKNASIAASNVLIKEVASQILDKRLDRINNFSKTNVTIMTTAAIDVWYKGQQYVIQAIPELKRVGINIKYLIVGEGSNAFLGKIAEQISVTENVEFTGRLPLNKVFELLDQTDIYIQPSLQEGLPRSVIEAMSRGCACIGARTAGIPELLDESMVVKRRSVEDIVKKIQDYVVLPLEGKVEMSTRNFNEASKYTSDVLDKRRNAYFEKIKAEIKTNMLE